MGVKQEIKNYCISAYVDEDNKYCGWSLVYQIKCVGTFDEVFRDFTTIYSDKVKCSEGPQKIEYMKRKYLENGKDPVPEIKNDKPKPIETLMNDSGLFKNKIRDRVGKKWESISLVDKSKIADVEICSKIQGFGNW
jgi:hypothetical protein